MTNISSLRNTSRELAQWLLMTRGEVGVLISISSGGKLKARAPGAGPNASAVFSCHRPQQAAVLWFGAWCAGPGLRLGDVEGLEVSAPGEGSRDTGEGEVLRKGLQAERPRGSEDATHAARASFPA